MAFFISEAKKRDFRLPPFSIAFSDRKCRTIPGPLGKRIKSDGFTNGGLTRDKQTPKRV
jgi:hypothetical protein